MKQLFLLFIATLAYTLTSGQQLLTENFSDTATQPITSYGWTQNGLTSTNPISATSAGLTYSGYVLSGVGNAAKLTTSGQIVYRNTQASSTSGSVYASFMLRIDTAQAGGDYFFALSPTSFTTYTGRVSVKLSSTGYYKIGVSKAAETVIYGNDSFATGVTTLVVLKYKYISGTANDSVVLYTFSSGFPATEPSQFEAATNGGTSTDATTLGRVALRQGSAAIAPALVIDGIRVGVSWADLNTATTTPPSPATLLSFTAGCPYTATVNWNKPVGYVDSTMTTLIFARLTTAVTQGIPSASPNTYSANGNFAAATSKYQNDTLAFCVYKGDLATVSLTGLAKSATYQLLAYAVHDADSAYSTSVTTTGFSSSTTPAAITSMSLTATGQTTATISWTKPATCYNNALNTMVIFVKQAVTITTTGSHDKNPLSIVADSNFSGIGSKFQSDTLAKCVYKGDSSTVMISGLTLGTQYYVLGYAISDIDSVYSTIGATATGITNNAGPLPVTALVFAGTSTSTANIIWTKDANYNNSAFTTLVYLKAGSLITKGKPSTNPTSITADANFAGVGSRFVNDSNAICVFKGDTNRVSVTGLNPATTYYLLVYTLSDVDSSYSNPVPSKIMVSSEPISTNPLAVAIAPRTSTLSPSVTVV